MCALTMPISQTRRQPLTVNLPLAASLSGRVAGAATFTRASDQWDQDDAEVWQKVTANVPAFNSKGVLLEPASTNKCTCYGVIPAESLSLRGEGTNLAPGNVYIIITRATLDFATQGATDNNVGTRFVATGTGTLGAGDSVNLAQYAVGTKSYYTGGSFRQNHSGMTLSGDTAAVLTTADGAATLVAGGFGNIAPSGKWYKLDNSAGSTVAPVAIGGVTGNTNIHSSSIIAMVTQGTANLRLNATNPTVITPGSVARVTQVAETPSDATRQLRIEAGANSVVYFLVPQLEELPFTTSPVVTNGATASRAQTTFNIPVAGNIKTNDFTITGEVVLFAANPGSYPQIITAVGTIPDAISVQFNIATMKLYAQRTTAGPTYNATGTATVVYGTPMKFAAVFSKAGLRAAVGGALLLPHVNTSDIGFTGVISFQTSSAVKYIKNLRIYRRALSDAQLVVMTT